MALSGKLKEKSLAEVELAEGTLRRVIASLPIGAFVMKARRFQLVNSEFEKISGYSETELLEMAPRNLVMPGDREKVREEVIKMLKGERSLPFEFRLIRKDRQIRWVMETVASIQYRGSQAVLGHYMDLTQHKQAEEALLRSEERFRSFMNSATDGFIIFDSNLNYVDINPVALWRLGLTKEEVIGKNLLEIRPEIKNTTRYEKYLEVIKTGKPLFIEEAVLNYPKAGNVYLQMRGFRVDGGLGIISTDITERKRAEQRLLAYQKELRSLASQLTLAEARERRLIATEVHDSITQTLVLCSLKLDTLRRSISSDSLAHQLSEAHNLIKQLVEESRSLTFEISSPLLYQFGLEAAVEQLVEEVQRQHKIECVFREEGPAQVLAEDERVLLFQTVRELLINIVKHARASHIGVSLKRQGEKLRILVEDDGIGFDASQAASDSKTTNGFGLFSIRERLRHVGGHLKIESEPGHGSHLTIVYPLSQKRS